MSGKRRRLELSAKVTGGGSPPGGRARPPAPAPPRGTSSHPAKSASGRKGLPAHRSTRCRLLCWYFYDEEEAQQRNETTPVEIAKLWESHSWTTVRAA